MCTRSAGSSAASRSASARSPGRRVESARRRSRMRAAARLMAMAGHRSAALPGPGTLSDGGLELLDHSGAEVGVGVTPRRVEACFAKPAAQRLIAGEPGHGAGEAGVVARRGQDCVLAVAQVLAG